MALYLNVSDSLDELAKRLCDDISQNPKPVFQPVYIITQTEGMNAWLKQKLAAHFGIAANYRYLKSQEIINQVYFLLGGRSSEILSSENLSWIIFKLLGEAEFRNKFKDVSAYYSSDPKDEEVKKMALAEKIADLFDQYQIYRPEMIMSWNKDADSFSGWQEYLWKRTKLLLNERLPDKTNLSRFIVDALKDTEQQERLHAKMPVVYLFGLSITTNYHMQVYHELGKIIDLKFHLINPAPSQYWFEDKSPKQLITLAKKGLSISSEESGNTLLTSWGKVIQDTYNLLFRDEQLLNAYEEVEGEKPTHDSLLKKIQNDIFLNSSQPGEIMKADILDGSIKISSCYGTAREVEVLYNYLVQLVEKYNGKLSARDIVVMVSDISTYAPYIKAVFDNAPYKFRYTISDESYSSGDTVTAALQSLLDISEDSFTSENVVQLLDSAFIRKRFGINDVSLIREVVNKANIRFGIENNKEDESVYVSWTYGLKRIMYGICISGEAEYGEGSESFYPMDIIEGSSSEQLIRFSHFVQVLIDALKEREGARSIKEHVEYVQRLIDNMICEPDITTTDDYLSLIKQLEAFNTLNEYFTDKVSFQVFRHSFSKMLGNHNSAGSFASSGITFCSLIPMRSIPFKVVAMLGLNFDKFPRRENPLSFNLMEKEKRRGDRNVKENDKHLFLETLLSAQEYFYMSYVGQSSKDNTSIPPSALVDELIDYIDTAAPDVDVRSLMVTKHPLHGFSRKYNQRDEQFVTYLNSVTSEVKELLDENKEAVELSFDVISIDSMISFFKNPVKGYYNNVLKVFYNDEDVLLTENEVFEPDHLESWSLKQDLISMAEGESVSKRNELVKKGQLPLKNMADVVLQQLEEDVETVRELFLKTVKGEEKEAAITLDLQVDDVVLKLHLENIYGKKLVMISLSKRETKYLLEAYIRYVALRAAGLDVELNFISKAKANVYVAESMSEMEAKQRLTELIKLYKQGHTRILGFNPQLKITPDQVDDLDEKIFHKAVKDVFDNYNFSCSDSYGLAEYKKGLYHGREMLEWYKSNCEHLLKPLAEVFPGYTFKD